MKVILSLYRLQEASDLEEKINKDEIKRIVTEIEEEMQKLHDGTSLKYKAKFRSLVFTIRDPNNPVRNDLANVGCFNNNNNNNNS